MSKSLRALVLAVLLAGALSGTANAEVPPGLPVQLEIGDSWTYGDGASEPAVTGYAGIVYRTNITELDCIPAESDAAVDGCRNLERVILARPGTAQDPGVTTDLLIDEQLSEAVSLLDGRNGDPNPQDDVEVILLSVGGNDVTGPVLQACLGGLSPGCLDVMRDRLAHVEANLDAILEPLRANAGSTTKIVVTTYDNPIPHCPLGEIPGATELGALALEGNAALGVAGLNNVIRETATVHDVIVADTYGRLGAGQWVGDCLHPNDAGHAEIARIVSAALHG